MAIWWCNPSGSGACDEHEWPLVAVKGFRVLPDIDRTCWGGSWAAFDSSFEASMIGSDELGCRSGDGFCCSMLL